MTYVLLGAVGAISVLLLFISGAIIGWTANVRYRQHLEALRPAAAEPAKPTPEQLAQFKADQEAFEAMLHYSPEIAYGLQNDPLKAIER